MSSGSKVRDLMTEADAAYEAENGRWFEALPIEDLTALWGVACANVGGASWDDEVFDALDKRGWFDTPMRKAT